MSAWDTTYAVLMYLKKTEVIETGEDYLDEWQEWRDGLHDAIREQLDEPKVGPRRAAALFDAQGGLCFFCEKKMESWPHHDLRIDGYTYDHLWPQRLGGGYKGNLVLAHFKCNQAKGGRSATMEEADKYERLFGCPPLWIDSIKARQKALEENRTKLADHKAQRVGHDVRERLVMEYIVTADPDRPCPRCSSTTLTADACGWGQACPRVGTIVTKAMHERALRELPCVISGNDQFIELHHCHAGSMIEHGFTAGASLKALWPLQIPLAHEYHTGEFNPEAMGMETWEAKFGTQIEHLRTVSEWLGYDVLALAHQLKNDWR